MEGESRIVPLRIKSAVGNGHPLMAAPYPE